MSRLPSTWIVRGLLIGSLLLVLLAGAFVAGLLLTARPQPTTNVVVTPENPHITYSLSMRTHICPSCALVLDQDWNAALNILAAALVLVAPTSRTAGQAGTGSASPEQNASGQTATTRCVRKSTSQTGWMKEESPGVNRESVNRNPYAQWRKTPQRAASHHSP